MTTKQLFALIKENILTIFVFGIFLASVSFFSLIITQKSYRASTDLLVTQSQNGFVDYYTLSKSADFLTNVLVGSVYSDKFLAELDKENVIPADFLPSNKVDRLKEWEKAVIITRNPSLGMIHIEVYGQNQKQITEISEAIIKTMTTQYSLFLGKGQEVDVRVLNGPTWEKNPSPEQIGIVVLGGFLIGCFLAFAWIYYKNEMVVLYEEEEYSERLE